MEAFIDMTKLVEAFGLEKVLCQASRKTVDKSLFQKCLCHMTCHSQLEASNLVRYRETVRERDALYTEDPHFVGLWIFKIPELIN